MAQVVSDVLPIDAGTQKFMAPVDPAAGTFALLWAVAAQTFSSKIYAAMGVLPVWRMETTHSALSVTTSPVKRGTAGSSTAAIDARGFNRVSAFVVVSGLGEGETLEVRMVPRLTATGSDFSPDVVLAGALTNGNNISRRSAMSADVTAPYFMIEAVTSAGTATVTIDLYVHRG
jgi:hypothetical protein